jgi:hypothetical protein
LISDNLIKIFIFLKNIFSKKKEEKREKKKIRVALGHQGVAQPPHGAKGMAETTRNVQGNDDVPAPR